MKNELYSNLSVQTTDCKVIFLGDGGSGKTYTIKRFMANGKQEQTNSQYYTLMTQDVEKSDYFVQNGNNTIALHFWDFGGQVLMHSLHNCFLTKQAVYVVTVSTRVSSTQQRAYYWLRKITAFAPEAPIMLFVNCWENDNGMRSIDECRLKSEFISIQKIVYCSAKYASEVEFRETIMDSIIYIASKSYFLNIQIPESWKNVSKAIQSFDMAYLTKGQFRAICDKYGIENDQDSSLLTWLNNLGICFSYLRDINGEKELMDYKLLVPAWLTNAFLAIAAEGMAFAIEGKIPVSGVEQILRSSAPNTIEGSYYRRTAPDLIYTSAECAYIIDIAESFGRCYRINENTLFFPALCATNTPIEAFVTPTDYQSLVEYHFTYDYLPESVIHMLMVRLSRKDFVPTYTWLSGMVIRKGDYKAVISLLDYSNILSIRICSRQGASAKELFSIVRDEIIAVNSNLSLQAYESIVDGSDTFPLAFIANTYANGIEYVFGHYSGRKIELEKLLLSFFDIEEILNMVVNNDGSITIKPYRYHKCSPRSVYLRRALYESYNRRCTYCGKLLRIDEMQIDHILSIRSIEENSYKIKEYTALLSDRGFDLTNPNYIENCLPCCRSCNARKSNKMEVSSLMFYHDIALRHTSEVIALMSKYKKQQTD